MDIDIVAQALSGVDGAGDYVLTPVASDANYTSRHYGDGDISTNDAVDDDASEDSGDSVEDGGVNGQGDGGGGEVEAGGGGEEGGNESSSKKPKRAVKLVRGLSSVARKLKKRSMGASEALTLGRISLVEGNSSSSSSYVRAHDVDNYGARAFTSGWGNGVSSPESGTR